MLLAVLAYMGVVASLKVLRIGFVAPLLSQWTFLVGIPIGVLFVWIDVVVEASLHPGSQTARFLRRAMQRGGSLFDRSRRIAQALRTLATQETHLCSQNVLFAGLWVVMALFGLTSTSSAFGKGVVLGIGLQLVVRLAQSMHRFGHQPSTINHQPLRWFFWPIRYGFSSRQEQWLARGFLAAFFLLTLLA